MKEGIIKNGTWTSNLSISTVRENLTHNSLPSKDGHTIQARKCFFIAHTLMLQKGHCKQSLHLQKALNDAPDKNAGVAPPGRVKEKTSWDEVIQVNWILE